MYCTNCGKEIPDNSKFCTNCGAVIKTSENEDDMHQGEYIHNKKEDNFADIYDDYNLAENNNYNNSRSTGKVIGICLGVLALALIAGIVAFMITNSMSKNNRSNNNSTKVYENLENSSSEETKDGKNNSDADITKSASDNHTYKVIKQNFTWDEAKEYCEQQGGYLATITSEEEREKIYNLLDSSDVKVVWLGATDLRSSGNYEWITGENFVFTDWAPGEPNNDGGIEHYLVVYKVNGKWVWNDGPVDTNKAYDPNYIGFVCEWDN